VSATAGWRQGAATLLAFGWLCWGPAALAQSAPEIFREISAANLSADAAALQGPNVVRSRYVEVDLERVLAGASQGSQPSRSRAEARKRLTFNLFADAAQEFEEDRAEFAPDGQSFAWYGRPTSGDGQALLVVQDGAVAGSVKTASGEFYRIRSVGPNVHVIRQVTYQGAPPVDDAVPVPDSEVPQAAKAQQAVVEQSASTTLDVMIVYTAAARQAAGGSSGIQSEINLAIAELNQSFSNSGVSMQARLAHSAEVSYNDQVDLSTSLSRLRTSGDGYMDGVHALRDQYGADVVALLVNGPGSNGGTVGTGYVMQTVGSYFSAYAFSVTEVNFATGPAYALLHEIGHNLGCAHDRDHASAPGAYPYSYGYQRAQTPRFRTIMSYNCSGANCPTINYWSNPNVNYQGYPTGVSSSASNSADNRQSLNNTKATALAWRQGSQNTQYAPSAVSVSPSSGSGSSQTFSYTFSDANGYADLPAVQMLINSALRGSGACHLYYSRAANRIYLKNDTGSAWSAPIVLGSSATLQNSQCTVNGSGSSATASGNNLTVNVALTFQGAFEESKTNYLYAQDTSGSASGWQAKGSWTVPAPVSNQPPPPAQQAVPPQATSVSPSSGSGSSRTFSYLFSDSNGYGDVASIQILLNDTLRSSGACKVYVARAGNQLYLLNDSGSAWLGPVTPGASGAVTNSQCTINAASSSITGSANNLSVQLATTFSAGFAGTKYNYMWVYDSSGLSSGWQLKGSWTVTSSGGGSANQPPSIAGVNPSSGSGSSRSFTFSFSDPNGYGDISATQMLIGHRLTGVGTCHLYYARGTNLVYLKNDAGSAWLGPVGIGSSASLENSQCSINAGASASSSSGNNLSVSVAVTFRSGFRGSKQSYLYAHDSAGLATGWVQVGTWTIP
jgi:hypothetical protein